MNDENENLHRDQADEPGRPAAPAGGRGVGAVAIVLACALVAGLVYAWRERATAQNLALQQDQTTASLSQARSEIDALAAKVNSLSTPPAPAPAGAPAASTTAPRTTRRPRLAEDRHWTKLQQQLKDQQQQLDSTRQNLQSTQQDLADARSELAGNLASARDELGGSIARTHDELVSLEQKGERNYFEFDLTKSKHFQRVGPIGVALHKVNTKHDFFDLAMLVNDFALDKKHVSLFEPVLIYPSDSKQAMELVVNHISKNRVHGYLSVPKYSEAEASATSPSGASDSSPAGNSPAGKGEAPSLGTGSPSSNTPRGTDSAPASKPNPDSL